MSDDTLAERGAPAFCGQRSAIACRRVLHGVDEAQALVEFGWQQQMAAHGVPSCTR
jgi:hypothetical protein